MVVARAAARDLKKLSADAVDRIRPVIDRLESDPRPGGVKKLRGEEATYRIRVGDFRVPNEVHDEVVTVLIIRVRHRKDAYE